MHLRHIGMIVAAVLGMSALASAEELAIGATGP